MSDQTPTQFAVSPAVAKQALQTLHTAARQYRGTAEDHGAIQSAAQLLGQFIVGVENAADLPTAHEEPQPGPMGSPEPNRRARRAGEAKARHKKP